MNSSSTTPLKTVPLDEDLAEQARPGHGIPSQEPESAAQFPLKPEEAEREAKSVLIGGGVVAWWPVWRPVPPLAWQWRARSVWWWAAQWVRLWAHWALSPQAPC